MLDAAARVSGERTVLLLEPAVKLCLVYGDGGHRVKGRGRRSGRKGGRRTSTGRLCSSSSERPTGGRSVTQGVTRVALDGRNVPDLSPGNAPALDSSDDDDSDDGQHDQGQRHAFPVVPALPSRMRDEVVPASSPKRCSAWLADRSSPVVVPRARRVRPSEPPDDDDPAPTLRRRQQGSAPSLSRLAPPSSSYAPPVLWPSSAELARPSQLETVTRLGFPHRPTRSPLDCSTRTRSKASSDTQPVPCSRRLPQGPSAGRRQTPRASAGLFLPIHSAAPRYRAAP